MGYNYDLLSIEVLVGPTSPLPEIFFYKLIVLVVGPQSIPDAIARGLTKTEDNAWP